MANEENKLVPRFSVSMANDFNTFHDLHFISLPIYGSSMANENDNSSLHDFL